MSPDPLQRALRSTATLSDLLRLLLGLIGLESSLYLHACLYGHMRLLYNCLRGLYLKRRKCNHQQPAHGEDCHREASAAGEGKPTNDEVPDEEA